MTTSYHNQPITDEESEKKKAEWREAAKKELQDWYKHREEMLEKTKVTNRLQWWTCLECDLWNIFV